MNKKGSSWIFYILILTALIVGFAVNSTGFDVNVYKSNMNWTHVNVTTIEQPDLSNALESLINGLGETAMGLMKWIAQWSSENPTIPYKVLIWCVLFAIFAPLLLVLFKFSIILFILIREWIQSSKEKRNLKELRNRNK